eukprot:scaffold80606_cov74-Phaeocystis_antarctica.AAC.1
MVCFICNASCATVSQCRSTVSRALGYVASISRLLELELSSHAHWTLLKGSTVHTVYRRLRGGLVCAARARPAAGAAAGEPRRHGAHFDGEHPRCGVGRYVGARVAADTRALRALQGGRHHGGVDGRFQAAFHLHGAAGCAHASLLTRHAYVEG